MSLREEPSWLMLYDYLDADEIEFLNRHIGVLDREEAELWRPLEGPQLDAFSSDADIIGYGGAAGGGKTDLLCGKALTRHNRVLVLRHEKAQTEGIVQRITEILGHTDGYNSQRSRWQLDAGRLIEFGGLEKPGAERRWQGRPHDLKAFDEVTEMREGQVRFCMGWSRTSDPDIRPQVLMTFNPPTTTEGRWVLKFFAPWLDPKHPNRAKHGELRWFTTIGGRDIELPDNRPFVLHDGQTPIYDFDLDNYQPEEIIKPKSRTFIPARVTDNKYYMETGYMSQLQALPEPLRSQMLFGDFTAGIKDDPMQVIPTKWVELAMERWERPAKLPEMDSLGIDIARGGGDLTVIARRHGMWFDEPITYPGTETPDGPTTAALVIAATRDNAPQHIDVIGVGSSPYDFLVKANQPVVGVDVRNTAWERDQSGLLKFSNLRTQLWWKMREALDPANNTGITLPPSDELKADLCAPLWDVPGRVITVESRDKIVDRIGRSPDYGTAYIMALIPTPEIHKLRNGGSDTTHNHDYDPYDVS